MTVKSALDMPAGMVAVPLRVVLAKSASTAGTMRVASGPATAVGNFSRHCTWMGMVVTTDSAKLTVNAPLAAAWTVRRASSRAVPGAAICRVTAWSDWPMVATAGVALTLTPGTMAKASGRPPTPHCTAVMPAHGSVRVRVSTSSSSVTVSSKTSNEMVRVCMRAVLTGTGKVPVVALVMSAPAPLKVASAVLLSLSVPRVQAMLNCSVTGSPSMVTVNAMSVSSPTVPGPATVTLRAAASLAGMLKVWSAGAVTMPPPVAALAVKATVAVSAPSLNISALTPIWICMFASAVSAGKTTWRPLSMVAAAVPAGVAVPMNCKSGRVAVLVPASASVDWATDALQPTVTAAAREVAPVGARVMVWVEPSLTDAPLAGVTVKVRASSSRSRTCTVFSRGAIGSSVLVGG